MSNGFLMPKAYGLEGFGEVKPKKDEKWDTHIHFDEMAFLLEGNIAHCFAIITQTNAFRLKDKDTQKELELPAQCYFKIDASDGNCSKWIVEELKKLDASSCFKGFIKPTESLPVDSEQKWELFKSDIFKLESTTNKTLKRENCKVPTGKGGKQYQPPKTKDVLAKERLKALQIILNEGEEADFNSLMLLASNNANMDGMDKIRYFEVLAAMIA